MTKAPVRIDRVASSRVRSAVIEAKVSTKRSRVEPRLRAPPTPWARKTVTTSMRSNAAPIAANTYKAANIGARCSNDMSPMSPNTTPANAPIRAQSPHSIGSTVATVSSPRWRCDMR